MNTVDADHLIQVLTAIRKVTRIIISEKDVKKLITRICNSLFESREYLNTWIVLVDKKGNYTYSAEAGIGTDFAILNQQFKKGKFTPCMAKAMSLQKLHVTYTNNNACVGCMLTRESQINCGISVPMVYKKRLYGVLNISLHEKNVIEAEESKLLNEVAQDLGFALHAIELENQKNAANLKAEEEQFLMKTLMNKLPENVYFKNLNSEFIRVNKSMLKIFKASSPEQVIGKSDFDFFKDEHARQAFNDEQNIIKTLQPILDFEEKETWPDGSITWVSTTKMPMLDDAGKVVGTFGISKDITRQKETEESLRNSQEMFQKMGMGSLDSIIIINNKGIVEFWNPAAEKLFGYSGKFAKGKKVHELIMPQKYSESQKAGWSNFIKTGLGGAIGKVVELSAKKADGNEFPVEMALSTLNFDGEFWALASIRDITERKEANKLLKERDEILSKLTENVPGMIFKFILHPDGKIEFPYCSDGIKSLFGLRFEDIKDDGYKLFDLIHHNDIEALTKSIDESAKSQSIWKHQFRIILKNNNEEKWIKGEARPRLLETGSFEWYGYVFNVTEQKLINDQLRLKNEQFQLVVEGANDGIWDWDLITNEIYLSPKWKKQLGYADHELENSLKQFTQLVHKQDLKKVMLNLRKYLEGSLKTYDIEFRMCHKSGDYIWINAKGEAVRNEKNKPIRLAGSHSDITDRIKAKKSLETEHARIRAIMNSVQSGIIVVRKRDRVIVDANPAVEKILGISADKFINSVCNKYICPIPDGDCPIIDLGNELTNAECSIRNYKNELMPIIKNVSEIELNGELYFIESFVDISEQKETEKQLLKEKEKADMANKAKSEFLANMSHEIRTPMNSILGFSEVLLNKVKNEKYLSYIRTILSSGRTLLSLINDILDLSKIEAGRLDVLKNPANLPEIVSEVAQLFEQKTQEKNINLIVDIEKGFPQTIEIDEIRVRQILLNILGNAVKFTSKGYVKIKVEIKQKNDTTLDLLMSISDTGVGISKEYIKNIFESFSQEVSDSTRKFEGTGLGLAISKRLCELMNGEIAVESEIGKGSVFSILLKNVTYSKEFTQHSQEFSWDSQNIIFEPAKILIVDDVEFNRDLIESFIEELNFELVYAENGEIAVERAKTEKPDLVLMDIKMPVMDGYEATEILCNNQETASIPVVALTASTMQTEDYKIEKIFDGYIRKPVQRNPLVLELSKFLKHKIIASVQENKDNTVENLLENSEDIAIQVKQAFNNKFSEKLIEFEKAMAIDDFERFAEELNKFAEENDIRYLRHQVKCLLQYIEEFEFNKIIEVLHALQNFFRTE